MDNTKIIQNTSQLNKSLNYLLAQFDKNKEWADISQWCQRVEQAIRDYPSPYIKEKIILAKRLAQCLNPMLTHAIHQSTLSIYSLLFESIKMLSGNNKNKYNQLVSEDLGIYAVGLFPFYQNGSIRAKQQFLELTEQFIIPLGRDLIPSLPGLLLCLLPGLEDNNEALKKQLNATLDKIFEASGRRYFLGSLWMAIMRQQRGRAAGIKLLQRYIPKSETAEQEQLSEDEDEDYESNQKQQYNKQDQQQQQQENQSPERQQNHEKSIGADFEVTVEQQQQGQDEQKSDKQAEKDQWNDFGNEMQETLGKQNQESNTNEEQKVENAKKQMLQSKNLDFQEIENEIDENNDINNFPNKSTLVLNTVIKCLEDETSLVKRTMLDFLTQYLNLKKELLNKQDRLVLVEALLYMFSKKDASISKRVNIWLFGKPDMENRYPITKNNEYVLEYIVQAMKNIFIRNEPVDSVTATNPIKILQNFYMEHDQLVDLTLKDISTSFIQYVYKYHEGYEFSADVKKFGRRFLQSIPQQIEIFMNSLSDEVVQKIKLQEDEECLNVVNLIKFTFENLIKLDHFSGTTARSSLMHTISGIFRSLTTLSTEDINKFMFIQPALNLVSQLVEKLEIVDTKFQEEKNTKKMLHQEKQNFNIQTSQLKKAHHDQEKKLNQSNNNEENDEGSDYDSDYELKVKGEWVNFDKAIGDFSTFYEALTKTLVENASKQKIKMLKAASMILVKIQKFLKNKQEIQTLPNWFKCITKSIKMKNPKISLVAIEAMIEILISEKKDPVYEILKNLIVEETKSKQKNDILISGSDYTKVTLEKLWSLLDFQYYHEQIIDLILNFSVYFPQYFKEVVVNSFTSINIAEQEASIRRFASFWKLTQQYYSQKAFLFELNKVGLFLMLDFLDHDNPLLRNASKNWLLDSAPQLYRIIDPLFEVLIQPSTNYYNTDQGQLIYTKQYDTKAVSDILRKLKSILVNASDMFMKYISSKELTPALCELQLNFTNQSDSIMFRNYQPPKQEFSLLVEEKYRGGQSKMIEKEIPSDHPIKMTYLDLLILICMKYIMGYALESMSTKFHLENGAVNASSCEFVEYLISHFEDPQLSMRLCQYILEPLMKVFNNSIINKEYVMQLQLLNLFKVIFFSSAFANKIKDSVQRQLIFTPILSSKFFIPNILKGLNTEISYIRQQFINFISQCLPIICQNLDDRTLTNQIKQILYSYSNMIIQYSRNQQLLQKSTSKSQINKEADLKGEENNNQRRKSSDQMFDNDNKQEMDDNDEDQQNSYDISIILQGVMDILVFFLKIHKVNKDESIMNLHNRQSGSVMGSVANVLSLGLISKSDDRPKIEYNFENYKETCECILFDIQKVLEMFIMSWNMSSSFRKISMNFSKVGSQFYQFQMFNSYNNKLKVMIEQMKQRQNKGKVKQIIIKAFSSLLLMYPQHIMNSLINLWNRECQKEVPSFNNPFPKTVFMNNLVEMLVMTNLSNDFFLEAFSQSDYLYRVHMNYQKKHPKEKKNHFVLNISNALEEARVMYFLYIYFSFVLIEGKSLQKESLLIFWMQVIKILKTMGMSRNPSTYLWILEFIYMLSRKFSPKEILNDTNFKKQLHDLISEKLNYLTHVASKAYTFVFNTDPTDFQIDKKTKKDPKVQQPNQQTITLLKYTVVVPFTPTQYELALKYQKQFTNVQVQSQEQGFQESMQKRREQAENLSESMIAMFANAQTTDEDDIYEKYRLYILKTIKRIALDLLQNTYAPEKAERIVSRTREFMEPLFPVIEDKSEKNSLFLECASELLHSLLEKAPNLLIKEFKKSILDIFNKDNFFSQSKHTLKYWTKIIDKVVGCDKYTDLFGEYLSKITLSGSFFSKESTINNTRVKSFKRVCFIIFSGGQDQYTSKLKLLLDKISEVIKNAETVHPSLLILILFCIRILILRLSNTNLKELFKQIWPMLITLLIQIYGVNTQEQQKSSSNISEQTKNPNLLLAGLKLIEILSISQFDEFYLHQWIFVFDYFGLQVKPKTDSAPAIQQQQNKSGKQEQPKKLKMTPFNFQPYISNCMPNQEYFHYVNQSYEDEVQICYQPRQRRIVMTQSKVDDEMQLRYQAWQLCLYLISCNEYRSQVDPKVIEDLIEDDFIHLDENVLKV